VTRVRDAVRRAALAAAFALVAGSAQAAPGDRQYVLLTNHDQNAFLRALRAGQDFLKGGGRQFRIVLANAGVVVMIPGTSTAQREYLKYGRRAGLEILACKETIDALSKANRRRVPVLPGVTVQPCRSLRDRMNVAGWQVAPGF
jgi:hypothetical protein